MSHEHIHFVTGRLAEHSLQNVLAELAPQIGFDYSIDVLKISVAALMTPEWAVSRMNVPSEATQVLLPGYCGGDLSVVEGRTGVPVHRGPKDLRELPEYFGRRSTDETAYGDYDIEIVAEINHAPRLSTEAFLAEADRLRADGADLIDVGCEPGDPWKGVGPLVRRLVDCGHRVSIDSMNPAEIEPAVRAGAELVLSVNAKNRRQACDWGVEVVAVPDETGTLDGLEETIERLSADGVPWRIDPVLEPVGFGFAASLERYFEARRRWPDAAMMMGIGNLTELTEVDSAGVNVILLAICQELGITRVLTTEVINWAQSCVKECDVARRLVYHAVTSRTLPKHVDSRLVMLRDPKRLAYGDDELAHLAAAIKDHNYRLFVENDRLRLLSAGIDLTDADPFDLFEQLCRRQPGNLDPSHAFYLGYELAKAVTAATLGKVYRQDQALDWGLLTRPEESHRKNRQKNNRAGGDGAAESSENG